MCVGMGLVKAHQFQIMNWGIFGACMLFAPFCFEGVLDAMLCSMSCNLPCLRMYISLVFCHLCSKICFDHLMPNWMLAFNDFVGVGKHV